MNEPQAKIWRATLTPHRSLGPRGFLMLMAAFAALNFAVGLYFYRIGAWPVAGFMGLDVALVWFAFRRNFSDGDRAEHIEVTDEALVLQRVVKKKAHAPEHFIRPWVRIDLERDEPRDLVGRLLILFKGSATEIASFLSPMEREDLAKALRRALRR